MSKSVASKGCFGSSPTVQKGELEEAGRGFELGVLEGKGGLVWMQRMICQQLAVYNQAEIRGRL